MISEEEELEVSTTTHKKRRLQGACDGCRKKKTRCDSARLPGNICSNCITSNSECTHRGIKKRGPKSGKYVKMLEIRVEKLEAMLRKLKPDINLDWDASEYQAPSVTGSQAEASSTTPALGASGNEEDEDGALTEHMNSLQISSAVEGRFFGPASLFMSMKNAMALKNQYTGNTDSASVKRPMYWFCHPWERDADTWEPPRYQFPEEDLLQSLLATYFDHVNTFYPLLHEPTFRRSVEDGLHFRDSHFGEELLLVCATASRHSNDPRVFLEGSNSQLSCGWKWFSQVQVLRHRSMFAKPTLHVLQLYCLSGLFLSGTSTPESTWTLVGLGIRDAQKLGLHRKNPEGYKLTFEDELKKRAFWILISLDRLLSNLGRPAAIREEDFDLELPVECDDKYWEIGPDSTVTFKQPPDKPSTVTFFNCSTRLSSILASALNTLYSTKKYKVVLGLVGDQWEQRAVAELDSSLNTWIDSVPPHLRWDPARESSLFFDQSATLYSSYYAVRLQIHRPFIHKPSSMTFSSLAMCANAARSCSRVLDAHLARGAPVLPETIMSALTSGLVLLLSFWGKQPEVSPNFTREQADLARCMNLLRSADQRWTCAGRFWDMLHGLASVKDVSLSLGDTTAGNHYTLATVSDAVSPQNPGVGTGILADDPSARLPHGGEDTPTPICPSDFTGLYPSTDSQPSLPQDDMHYSYNPLDDPISFSGVESNAFNLPSLDQNSYPSFGTNPPVDTRSFDYTDTEMTDTLNMWSSAPVGFEIEDWVAYITSIGAQDVFPAAPESETH